MLKSPEFFYIAFILPSLFALTLVGEGVHRVSRREDGFFLLFLGMLVLVGIGIGYFLIYR